MDPLWHYCHHGWVEGRDPSADFSTQYYLSSNPDVVAAGFNPFWHYVVLGKDEGRKPRAGSNRVSREMIEISDAFDADFYLLQNPDVAKAGVDPLWHYCHHGWVERRDPNAEFSTEFYLSSNPDVVAANFNPFWHYIVIGKNEGRQARAGNTSITREMREIGDAFDADFYLLQNQDVAEAGADPLWHYCHHGWTEGRDPNPDFSTQFYLSNNPDVAAAGLNPFWHYIVAGRNEGRAGQHPAGYRAEMLLRMRPLEQTVVQWRKKEPPESLLDTAELQALVLADSDRNGRMLMISVGHDDYRGVSGGVQYCIRQEENIATTRGVTYLNIFPYEPLPRLAHYSDTPDVPVRIRLNGKEVGTAAMSVVTDAVRRVSKDFPSTEVVIHHLLGHCPENIAEMIEATGSARCWLWSHDFFTLCPSYVLQRNDVSFCGGPPPTSNACRLCRYGIERMDHVARIESFFDKIRVRVVAPSPFAARFWSEHSNLVPTVLTIQPHMTINWMKSSWSGRSNDRKKITVAFVGYPAFYKGWPTFSQLVRRNTGVRSEFRFVHFGTTPTELAEVEDIPVDVTAEDPDAMIRAIAEQGVDIVVHWASCAETFSFSAHEAFAGGAYVLTNPISGNVAATVKETGLGAVLDDESDLERFFGDGRAQRMVADLRVKRRYRYADISRSEMTFSVLDGEQVK